MRDVKDRTKQLVDRGLYHITWKPDSSLSMNSPISVSTKLRPSEIDQSLIQKTSNAIKWIASLGSAPDVDMVSTGLNWELVEKIEPVSKKDLPLYVSWEIGKSFERLLKGETS